MQLFHFASWRISDKCESEIKFYSLLQIAEHPYKHHCPHPIHLFTFFQYITNNSLQMKLSVEKLLKNNQWVYFCLYFKFDWILSKVVSISIEGDVEFKVSLVLKRATHEHDKSVQNV